MLAIPMISRGRGYRRRILWCLTNGDLRERFTLVNAPASAAHPAPSPG